MLNIYVYIFSKIVKKCLKVQELNLAYKQYMHELRFLIGKLNK